MPLLVGNYWRNLFRFLVSLVKLEAQVQHADDIFSNFTTLWGHFRRHACTNHQKLILLHVRFLNSPESAHYAGTKLMLAIVLTQMSDVKGAGL